MWGFVLGGYAVESLPKVIDFGPNNPYYVLMDKTTFTKPPAEIVGFLNGCQITHGFAFSDEIRKWLETEKVLLKTQTEEMKKPAKDWRGGDFDQANDPFFN